MRRVRTEMRSGSSRPLPRHACHLQHLTRALLHGCAQQGLGQEHAYEPPLLDDGQLGEIVVALQTGALVGSGVGIYRRYNGHGYRRYRGVVVSKG